eukprot:SAG22_NODE_295_length_12850_cov_9.179202_10_plen_222_part_00
MPSILTTLALVQQLACALSCCCMARLLLLAMPPTAAEGRLETPEWVHGGRGGDGGAPAAALRFARAYGDHMVLAASPKHASVWGYAAPGAAVKVQVAAIGHTADVKAGADGTWKIYLPPVPASNTAHTITATADAKTVQLVGVLFGAVWVCGGQVRPACIYVRPACIYVLAACMTCPDVQVDAVLVVVVGCLACLWLVLPRSPIWSTRPVPSRPTRARRTS